MTFAGESASGWQQATVLDADLLTANTTYVASYHTTTGFYAADARLLPERAGRNGPLQALANGTDGGNGVFGYGAKRIPDRLVQQHELLGRRGLRNDSERPADDGLGQDGDRFRRLVVRMQRRLYCPRPSDGEVMLDTGGRDRVLGLGAAGRLVGDTVECRFDRRGVRRAA